MEARQGRNFDGSKYRIASGGGKMPMPTCICCVALNNVAAEVSAPA